MAAADEAAGDPGPAPPRRPAGHARLVLLLAALSSFGPLSIDMYLPALPAMARDLQTSAAVAQLSLTACLAGLAAGQLLSGPRSNWAPAIGAMFGISPQLFSVIFAINGLGIIVAGQVARRLIGRVSPRALLTAGLTGSAAGGAALLIAAVTRAGLPAILPALFVVVASVGFILPNATALALANHASDAGSASGLLGLGQFAIGAAAAPLAGVAGAHTDLPMAIVICVLGISARLSRPGGSPPGAT